MQAEITGIIISGRDAVIASAIGIRIPKVPQDVPDAKPSTQEMTKRTAGISAIQLAGIFSTIPATNGARPRLSVMHFKDHASVRTRIGDTICLNPSGTQSMHSRNVRTRRAQ